MAMKRPNGEIIQLRNNTTVVPEWAKGVEKRRGRFSAGPILGG